MAKKKVDKEQVDAPVNSSIEAPVDVSVEKKDNLEVIKRKRDMLIAEIVPKLMSGRLMARGGSLVRMKYEREKGFLPVIAQINELGKKLSLRPIGLGHIRRD